MKLHIRLLLTLFLCPLLSRAQFNAVVEGESQFETVDVTKLMRIGSSFLDQDLVEIHGHSENTFRVRTDATTRLRVFQNGAVSLLSNWGNPQPNELRINGNTGIMVNDPSFPLHVNGNAKFEDNINSGGFLFSSNTGAFVNGSSLSLLDLNGDSRAHLGAGSFLIDYGFLFLKNSAGDNRVIIRGGGSGGNDAGYIELKDGTDPSIVLDANYGGSGFARISTDELEIKGGADLAEYFDLTTEEMEGNVKPGMLVAIDPETEGKLQITQHERDKKVVGIISGAYGIRPGLLLSQKASLVDGKYPVAILGRVYVLADATEGAIKAGDFLTSSDQPGYARKVGKFRKARGAIIGKAMTSLREGVGYVLVLINLQ